MMGKISMGTGKNKMVKETFEKFLRSKEAMNVSSATLDYYENTFKWFKAFVGEDALCENFTEMTVTDYLLHLKKTKPRCCSWETGTVTGGPGAAHARRSVVRLSAWAGRFSARRSSFSAGESSAHHSP